jgi:hypothetical protein
LATVIIKCIQLFDEKTNTFKEPNPNKAFIQSNGTYVLGYHYNVLGIEIGPNGIYYKIISDYHGAPYPASVRAEDFDVVSAKVPQNWIITNINNQNCAAVGPTKWLTFDLWKESFWQDYENRLSMALKCYQEEMIVIIKTDPEYTKVIIDERPSLEMFQYWHSSMMPILQEAQDNN